MSNTEFTKTSEGEYTTYSAIIRKTQTNIVIGPYTKSVHIKNASNQAWRGFGKVFPSFKMMAAGYKTAEMKAFIQAVEKDQRPSNVIEFA
jgi:hypothetical protein